VFSNLRVVVPDGATELERLRDRVEQLEQALGVDRSLTSRLRTAFGLEPGVAQVMGMLMKRDFVTHDALYVVLYAARPECDWPECEDCGHPNQPATPGSATPRNHDQDAVGRGLVDVAGG